MDELLEQFVVEARELVQQAADDLFELERHPDDRNRLESAFRAIHTLKGSVGLFELPQMLGVLHAAEDLLGMARDEAAEISAGLIDPIVAAIEWTDRCVTDIANDGVVSEAVAGEAGAILSLLQSGDEVTPSQVPPEREMSRPDWATALIEEAGYGGSGNLVALRYEPHAECFFNGDDPLAIVRQLPGIIHLKIGPRSPWPALADFDPFRCNLVIEALAETDLASAGAPFRLIPDQIHLVDLSPAPSLPDMAEMPARESRILRVDAARIDELVDITGELITAKNGLLALAARAREATGDDQLWRAILASQQDFERLTGALHGAIMQARMVPLAQTFRRFPRLVRETAARLGKGVELVLQGDDVEADKTISDALFEPLLHLVRNGIDHGIERQDERLAAGKKPRGTITIRASHSGGQLLVEVADDGRGMAAETIRATAVRKGILDAETARQLDDEAALQLVFAAGFSTAEAVTDISGRGVGLDVVQSAVMRLGGRAELTSVPGSGTTIAMTLPISFSMSRLLVVGAAGERFGVEMDAILETLRLRKADITPVRAGQAFVWRERTVPFLQLRDLLHLSGATTTDDDQRTLIISAGDQIIGLGVDSIAERTVTLTRPVTGLLRSLKGISGTTMLGDGHVLLVLDLEELVG